PGPGRRRALHPDRPELPLLQRPLPPGLPFRFVELAQEIDATMPSYVVKRAHDLLNEDGKALRGSTVLLLGVTYKPNIADQRESPAVPVAKHLTDKGATVTFHDPHVQTWHTTGTPMERVA